MDINLSDLTQSPFSEFCKKLKQLCAPLFKQFNLNYFDYARFYANGTCWSLFTDPNYVDYFSKHPAYTTPPFLRPNGAYLWAGYIPPEFLDSVSDDFNYFHGLTLVTHMPDHVEVVNLAAPATEHEILNLYLNHQDLLKLFTKYITQEVLENETHLKKARIIIPSDMTFSPPTPTEDKVNLVLEEISKQMKVRKNNKLMMVGDTLAALSTRELDCLHYLKLGYPNKLIARTLNVSHRTIEKYFEKIYQKYNLKGRLDLVHILMQQP